MRLVGCFPCASKYIVSVPFSFLPGDKIPKISLNGGGWGDVDVPFTRWYSLEESVVKAVMGYFGLYNLAFEYNKTLRFTANAPCWVTGIYKSRTVRKGRPKCFLSLYGNIFSTQSGLKQMGYWGRINTVTTITDGRHWIGEEAGSENDPLLSFKATERTLVNAYLFVSVQMWTDYSRVLYY